MSERTTAETSPRREVGIAPGRPPAIPDVAPRNAALTALAAEVLGFMDRLSARLEAVAGELAES